MLRREEVIARAFSERFFDDCPLAPRREGGGKKRPLGQYSQLPVPKNEIRSDCNEQRGTDQEWSNEDVELSGVSG